MSFQELYRFIGTGWMDGQTGTDKQETDALENLMYPYEQAEAKQRKSIHLSCLYTFLILHF